ncbi:hypothetical protein [Alteromonas sp. H39]|uniref:hypothetical protein n=1 Tax=Alteromonas sp. H39 TaxID=3389876 RepID=UPI0039E0FED3
MNNLIEKVVLIQGKGQIEQLEKRRDVMQFEELFARIESPSSTSAALRLFNVSNEELAATYKPSPTES